MNAPISALASKAAIDLDRLTKAQALCVDVIHDLMAAASDQIDASITRALARLGEFGGADRTYVFLETRPGRISNTHEWCAPGIEPMIDQLQDIPREVADAWWHLFDVQPHIHIRDVDALDDEDPVKASLQEQGIRSLLVVPLRHDGRLTGFVGYDAVGGVRDFLEGEIYLLQAVAGIIAGLLTRREIETDIARTHAIQDVERKRMQATLSVLPDMLLEISADLRITAVHANSDMAVSFSPSRLQGKRLVECLSPDALALADRLRDRLSRSAVTEHERLAVNLNGVPCWFSISAARRPPEVDGTPGGYVAIVRDVTELVQSRLQIDRLGQIAQQTTNLIVITDPEGGIEWVNPAFEARTGYTLDEVRGRKPGHLLQCPQTDPQTIERLRVALSEKRAITCEILNQTRTGEQYWLELSIQPILDERGVLSGFMSVQTDMTQHHRAAENLEQALASERSAREQLRSAVGIMQDAFIQFDKSRRLVLCNQRYRDLHPEIADLLIPGTPLADILQAGIARGCFSSDTMSPENWIAAELASFDLRFSQSMVICRAGRWLRLTKQPTPDGGRMILLSDITELKAAEQNALTERERAMDASRDGIAMLSPGGEILYANAAAARIFGRLKPADILGLHWRELLTGEAMEQLEHTAGRALESNGFWEGELQANRPYERPVDVEVSATRHGDGGTLCILRDISEKRRVQAEQERLRAELELSQRREEVGQIAAGLTHDFNNLLSAISGAATLITESGDDTARVMADSIVGAVDQASGLVRRMMSLGKKATAKHRIDLRDPVRDAVELVEPSLRSPLRLLVEMPDAPLSVAADRTSLMQMVLNLAINARDALSGDPQPGAMIRITLTPASAEDMAQPMVLGQVQQDQRYLCISVIDNGPGMDAATRENIFSAYFSTKGDRGTGLGLPIVAGAVRDHGGTLSLRTAPGEGATFSILLPAATA